MRCAKAYAWPVHETGGDDARPASRLIRVHVLALALVAAVLAAGVGILAVDLRPAAYVANAAAALDQPLTLSQSQDAGVVDKLSRLRLKYAGLVRSDDVVVPVAQSLGLSRGAVAGAVVTRQDPDSLVLFVGARAATAKRSMQIANALTAELQRYITREQSGNGIVPKDRISLRVLVPARFALQVAPTRRQKTIGGVGAAVVGALLVVGLAELPRRRRR